MDIRRYAVCAETIHDPHRNYTVLGRIIGLDRSNYQTDHDAALAAVRDTIEFMPESIDDILAEGFHVFTIAGESKWVSVQEAVDT
jgi:hypothetical protein